jgi:two-component system, response regulator PdtaR
VSELSPDAVTYPCMSQPHAIQILVVEDETIVRYSAVDALTDAGFEVVQAEDAREALAALAAGLKPFLLFTDVDMPGDTNGIELAERAFAQDPDLRIIITSGLPLLRGIGHLPARFLAKPYALNELCQAARGVCPQVH